MRNIDPTLRAKLRLAQQTYYQNADPHMEVIASRPRTPITYKEFWEEVIVTAGVTSICTSVTVRKTGKDFPDKAYVAYVTDSNTLVVKSADIAIPLTNMIWSVEETMSNCLACAVEFDGSFVRAKRDKVEFRAEETPWLFYVTSAGQLMAGVLGGSYESLVGANVTAIDAVRGVASKYKDIDQGLLVFYAIAGDLYYRDLIAGVWGDQKSVSIAPADIISVRAERTFDYRIVLQVTDTSGALHEIFTKMEAHGWNGLEFFTMSNIIASGFMTEISYSSNTNTERFKFSSMPSVGWNMSVYSPELLNAENLPIEDNYGYGYNSENWGFLVLFTLDQVLYNAEGWPADYRLSDDDGVLWYGQEVYRDWRSRKVYVLFNDFNNAVNPITATVLAGHLTNGYTDLVETSVQFNAINLVPTVVYPPEFVSIYNVDNQTIIVEFSKEIISIAAQTGFLVYGYEPYASPGGPSVLTNYAVDTIGYVDPAVEHTEDLSSGVMSDVEYSDGSVRLERG